MTQTMQQQQQPQVRRPQPSVLMIDNYDSFTYNLYQYLCELGAQVTVFRNDQITVEECKKLAPTHVMISPGPGKPDGAGISMDVIRAFAGQVPILGVCLGHQSIYQVFGGEIIGAGEIMHGKVSTIQHDGKGVFANVPQDCSVVRYHSLVGNPKSKVPDLEVTSQTKNGIIMSVRHRVYNIEGVQFHPESIKSEAGYQLLENFLNYSTGLQCHSSTSAAAGHN